MPVPKTVVISCAGAGTRLGFGHPKCLIDVHGEPLIAWQLRSLAAVPDVRIVVGFQARKVVETVLEYRRDVVFVFNHRFAETNALASLYLGAQSANQLVLSLDGDLLVHPDDMASAIESDGEWLAVGDVVTDEPVYANVESRDGNQWVTGFTRKGPTPYEWTGFTQVRRERLLNDRGHVYQCLERYLPIRATTIRSREVDTIADYEALLSWSAPLFANPR